MVGEHGGPGGVLLILAEDQLAVGPTSHGPEEEALWHVSILVSGGGAGHIGTDFIFHCDLSAGPGR